MGDRSLLLGWYGMVSHSGMLLSEDMTNLYLA